VEEGKQEEEVNTTFNRIGMVLTLAKETNNTFQTIMKMSLVECLYIYAYLVDRNEKELKKIKKV
jgi:hypothetical protein